MTDNLPGVEDFNKLISALQKLDGVLLTKGKNNYQERIHRIAKTLRSMTAHAYCVVSDFSLDDSKSKDLLESYMNYDYFHNKLISENKLEEMKISEDKEENDIDFKMDLNDLLKYMERELNSKEKSDNIENDNSSSED